MSKIPPVYYISVIERLICTVLDTRDRHEGFYLKESTIRKLAHVTDLV